MVKAKMYPQDLKAGDRYFELAIEPLVYDDLDSFKLIRDSNLEFLHTPRSYTLDETKMWYFATNPRYLAIRSTYPYGEMLVGYIRLNNISFPTIQVGMDLHKDWQNRGLGRILYIMLEAELSKMGFTRMHLFVLETNERAVNFYKRLGFQVYSTVQTTLFGVPHSLYMEKQISTN